MIGDGMADRPIEELGYKTILQTACKPNMDYMAKNGLSGMAKTVPSGFSPGSDVANMSIFGYDPSVYYTGRSPLEAVSMGISMEKTDLAFRCNLITIGEKENEAKCKKTDFSPSCLNILDHSSGHITTEEATELMEYVAKNLQTDEFEFTPGISYRHLLISKNNYGKESICKPPHDVIGQNVGKNLPFGKESEKLKYMILESYKLLKDHPINLKRIEKGKSPGNCIWFWGQGNAPEFPNFYDKYKKGGSVISAVDLLKGIGLSAGLDVINVKGATGFLDTNYKGKTNAAKEALKTQDVVFIHVEAPDECGHMGSIDKKMRAVEDFDKCVVGPLLKYAVELEKQKKEHVRILVLPDHPTPVHIRTHTNEAIPFILYDTRENKKDDVETYDEETSKSGFFGTVQGHELMNILFQTEKKA